MANRDRQLWRGAEEGHLKGRRLQASVAMADTATTASAAAASAANASTDAPPFQLGKPRFQQVRTGLWLEVGGWHREGSKLLPQKLFSPGVSDPAATKGACSYLLPGGPRPTVTFSHWSVVWARADILAPIGHRRRHSPPPRALNPSCQRRSVIGHCPPRPRSPSPGIKLLLQGRLGSAAAPSGRKVRIRPWVKSWRGRDAF